jgi:hypothetical protein
MVDGLADFIDGTVADPGAGPRIVVGKAPAGIVPAAFKKKKAASSSVAGQAGKRFPRFPAPTELGNCAGCVFEPGRSDCRGRFGVVRVQFFVVLELVAHPIA